MKNIFGKLILILGIGIVLLMSCSLFFENSSEEILSTDIKYKENSVESTKKGNHR